MRILWAVVIAVTMAHACPAEAGWKYRTIRDKMRNSALHTAYLESKNAVKFGFPYKGGHAVLQIEPGEIVAGRFFMGVRGQFLCGENEPVMFKLDDGPVEHVECEKPIAGDSSWVELVFGPDDMVGRLRTARTLWIEPTFYREGSRQFEFVVRGLKWDKKQ